jgi:hypothetical protein
MWNVLPMALMRLGRPAKKVPSRTQRKRRADRDEQPAQGPEEPGFALHESDDRISTVFNRMKGGDRE